MNTASYLDWLVKNSGRWAAMIRLREGRDILADIVAHDAEAVIIRSLEPSKAGEAAVDGLEGTSLIIKGAISVITPMKKKEEEKHTV